MAVRSRRLYGPALPGLGPTTLYTVPALRTLIIRSIVLWNGSGTTAAVARIHVNGSSSSNRLWAITVEPEETIVLDEPLILNPGDTLVWTTSNNTLRVFADGSLLDGAPA